MDIRQKATVRYECFLCLCRGSHKRIIIETRDRLTDTHY
uniref:MIP10819p n=1 Tax=Drosophila melanogaster TaxID=7227 RepID=C4XVJ1_DROME|nr:MIP10819p [Drosophila melanogaster]